MYMCSHIYSISSNAGIPSDVYFTFFITILLRMANSFTQRTIYATSAHVLLIDKKSKIWYNWAIFFLRDKKQAVYGYIGRKED